MRLIDADKLKNYLWSEPLYSDSINDRTYIREHIDEMPTVDAVPVELIKERFTRLRRRRMNLDDDCVDEAWDLKMQIEALEDLLNEWAWRNEE